MGNSGARARSASVRFGVIGLLSILLVACGASSGDSSSSNDSDPSKDGTETTVAGAGAQLFPDDFIDVCQGASQSRAKAIAETGPHKIVYIQTYEDKLQDDSQTLPADWTVQFDAATDAYAEVELVGCGVRTDEAFVKECTGYEDDGKPTGNTVKLYTATYEVSVREAKTGKEIASEVMEASDTECPMFQTFDEGEKVANVYQTPSDDQVVAFLKPHVQG